MDKFAPSATMGIQPIDPRWKTPAFPTEMVKLDSEPYKLANPSFQVVSISTLPSSLWFYGARSFMSLWTPAISPNSCRHHSSLEDQYKERSDTIISKAIGRGIL